MKIKELFEERRDDYFNRLEQELNIKRLGNGAFARTFQHPTHPNVAVKIFSDTDEGYPLFLRFCQKNPTNKYLPKILSVHHHADKEDTSGLSDDDIDNAYTIVFFEKLSEINTHQYKNFLHYAASLIDLELPSSAFSFNIFNAEAWSELAQQTKDLDFAKFAKFMFYLFKNDLAGPDLHERNVMLRGKQPVFTDPIV